MLQCVAVNFIANSRGTFNSDRTFENIYPEHSRVEFLLDVLQCVAVCCSVLQCVAVCCSALQSALKPIHTVHLIVTGLLRISTQNTREVKYLLDMLQCNAVCCSVLQCVAVSP